MQKISPHVWNVSFAVIALIGVTWPATDAVCAPEPDPPRYSVVGLWPIDRFANSTGQGINSGGVVAGASYWTGGATTLWENGIGREMPFGLSGANDINEAGHLVGNLGVGCCEVHGYFFDGTTLHNIHTPTMAALGTTSMPESINDHDEVVGWVRTLGGSGRSAYYWRNGVTVMLGTLGGRDAEASSINNFGKVVGYSDAASGSGGAFLWGDANENDVSDPGEMIKLPDMGFGSFATAINDSGVVAGTVHSGSHRLPVVWKDATAFTPLPILPGATDGLPYAINNQGEVVGFTSSFGATLWRDGQGYNLNDLFPASSGFRVKDAWSINDQGWITGDGFFAGEPTGFLLIPVPEPNSLAILAIVLFPTRLTRRRAAGG